MNNARLFGETPTFTFNGVVSGPACPENGVATIVILNDTIFSTLTFRWPLTSVASVSLAGATIPAGTILYGVASYIVTSGVGIAYHSSF